MPTSQPSPRRLCVRVAESWGLGCRTPVGCAAARSSDAYLHQLVASAYQTMLGTLGNSQIYYR
jgi:hypothetical protein